MISNLEIHSPVRQHMGNIVASGRLDDQMIIFYLIAVKAQCVPIVEITVLVCFQNFQRVFPDKLIQLEFLSAENSSVKEDTSRQQS